MTEVNFEEQSVTDALQASPVDLARPIFVNWLGVLQYLTTDAIIETLKGLPPCLAAIGYCLPESDAEWRSEVAAFLRTLAAIGEPFITLTTPHETAELLAAAGFRVLEDLGPGDVAARFGLSCVSPERIALAEKASTGR